MYEVNIRQYTPEGTLAAFETHLDRLELLDIGILWFMPVHPVGEQNRLGSLGSYYSVQDYLKVNPNYGTLDDFKTLVKEVHDRGMYIIIDWVANHTSWDNVLTETNPEWYVKNNQGEFIPPPGTNWSDVIELDYSKQGLRDFMIDAMKFWVDSVDVDGFRFDAVSFVPDDFWEEALPELKAVKPDIFLLAESNEAKYLDLGFHANYAWEYYGFGSGILTGLAGGSGSANGFAVFSSSEKNTYSNGETRLYFTSNHDENSWEGTPYQLFGDAAEAFAVLSHTFNGMPLIYNGEEAGMEKQLDFFNKDLIPWREHENAYIYKSLLQLKKENKALWNGFDENELTRISTSNSIDIFAFIREMDEEKVFAIFNFSGEEQTVQLKGNLFVGDFKNTFTDEEITFQEEDSVTLSGWGYAVYDNTGIITSIEEKEETLAFKLHQNYPNPFNPATNITYSLSQTSEIRLTVFDMLGREVQVLDSGFKPSGNHTVSFNASGLAGGVYIYRLETPHFSEVKMLTLIK